MKKISAIFCLTLMIFLKPVAGNASLADPPNWSQWRGPFFNGMAATGAPTEFGDAKNVKWKVAVAGRGFSTPVIWGDRMFLTTAVPTGKGASAPVASAPAGRGPGGGAGGGEEHKFIVMCLDRNTGKTLWEKVAKIDTPHEGYHRTYGSFASNSPVTDGKYLYASFGSRGIFCYDLNGKLIWEKDPGVKMRMRLQFGEGSAPLLHGNQLISHYDHEGGSFAFALDKNTGKEVWRVNRDEQSSWSVPFVADYKGRKQLIISATKKVRAYEPDTGKLIWECAGLGANVIPAPVQQNDILIVMSGYRDPKLMAIRLGREGDLTGTDAVLWSQTRGTSYTPAPVLFDNKLYTLTDNGTLSCFNATTGEPYYQQQRLPQPDSFKASPVGADGKIYLASESGYVTVIKMGEKYEVLANNLFADEMFVASPVIVAGDLYLRSKNNLYCIR
ncbi:MAG: PQQ-binding-like beta-propeller repeat protein [Acidobacteria bacterium]|nr:PQQ-binding-like beta-propeller repeat protein [Acidobacteriota bacterium]